jgi:hypothetical protein
LYVGAKKYNATNFDEQKPIPAYPDIKFQIDLSEIMNSIQIANRLTILIKEDLRFDIEMQLEDKESTTIRPLMDNLNKQKGDQIDVEKNRNHRYYIDFYKEVFDEEDKNRNCKNYPSKIHETYQECDKKFIRELLDDYKLRNFTPIWATDNMDEVTEQRPFGENVNKLMRLFTGIQVNNCPKPCTSTKTNVRKLTTSSSPKTVVSLDFSEEVTITKVEMVIFDFVTAFSFLGSNMGLWLGLGVLQFAEVLLNHLPNKMG